MKKLKVDIMEVKKIIEGFKSKRPPRTEDSAIDVAEQLISSLKINEYPIPIVKTLNELGFYVYSLKMPKPNISGFIMINPDLKGKLGSDRAIGVSSDDITGRQRFTMAHEFAHYLFDFDENKNTDYFDTYDINLSSLPKESIPSRFAAEFLMPKAMFVKRYEELVKKKLNKYDLIYTLVSDFNVSQKAVLKRCEELKDDIGRGV